MTCDVIVPGMVIVQTVRRFCEMERVKNEIKEREKKGMARTALELYTLTTVSPK